MKTIMKTIGRGSNLDYDKTFASPENLEIRRKLIPELQASLAPKFQPSVSQLTTWLNSLHKSRRSSARMRNSGKLVKDYHQIYANNHLNEV